MSATAAPTSSWLWGQRKQQQDQQAASAHSLPPPSLGGQPPGDPLLGGRGTAAAASMSGLTKSLLRGKLGGSTESVSSAGTTPGASLPAVLSSAGRQGTGLTRMLLAAPSTGLDSMFERLGSRPQRQDSTGRIDDEESLLSHGADTGSTWSKGWR